MQTAITRQSLSLAANTNEVDVNQDILEETGDIPADAMSRLSTSVNLMDYENIDSSELGKTTLTQQHDWQL